MTLECERKTTVVSSISSFRPVEGPPWLGYDEGLPGTNGSIIRGIRIAGIFP